MCKLILSCHWMNENQPGGNSAPFLSGFLSSPDLIVGRDFLSVTVITPVRSQCLGERNFRSHNRQGSQSISSSSRGYEIHSSNSRSTNRRQFMAYQRLFNYFYTFARSDGFQVWSRSRRSGVPGTWEYPGQSACNILRASQGEHVNIRGSCTS